jgi:hypothetical protein
MLSPDGGAEVAITYTLPYDPAQVGDHITWRLTEMALIEDWTGQLLFNKMSRSGRLLPGEETFILRRFLHVTQVLETELRMRYKERHYYGL